MRDSRYHALRELAGHYLAEAHAALQRGEYSQWRAFTASSRALVVEARRSRERRRSIRAARKAAEIAERRATAAAIDWLLSLPEREQALNRVA